MHEPPGDPPGDDPEPPALRLLQGTAEDDLDSNQAAFLAARLIEAAQAGFDRDLALQLDELCDGSLQPIDRMDPRWADMIKVATALVGAGFRIDNCHVGGHPGGACLFQSKDGDGVLVRWAQHDLAGYRFTDPRYRAIAQIMGSALAEVLRILGFTVAPTEHSGSYLVRP